MKTSQKVQNCTSHSQIKDLQIGKAGEYLVCADLILHGYVAYPSEQGLPYDVVFDNGDKLFRVQVKTTRGYKELSQRANTTLVYQFNIGRHGKNNRHVQYKSSFVDLFALVALDLKLISYLPNFDIRGTMNFRCPQFKGTYYDEQGEILKSKVIDLRKEGKTCSDIAQQLNMALSNVYKYSANVSIKQKGTNAGVYFDQFPLAAAIKRIELQTRQTTIAL